MRIRKLLWAGAGLMTVDDDFAPASGAEEISPAADAVGGREDGPPGPDVAAPQAAAAPTPKPPPTPRSPPEPGAG